MEHWAIEGESTEYTLNLRDPEGWYAAYVKWDGCFELRRFFNVSATTKDEEDNRQADTDQIHICDIDDIIARLQSLKAIANEHFEKTRGGWGL